MLRGIGLNCSPGHSRPAGRENAAVPLRPKVGRATASDVVSGIRTHSRDDHFHVEAAGSRRAGQRTPASSTICWISGRIGLSRDTCKSRPAPGSAESRTLNKRRQPDSGHPLSTTGVSLTARPPSRASLVPTGCSDSRTRAGKPLGSTTCRRGRVPTT